MTVMVRYSLQVTEELDRPLEEMADEVGTTKSDVLRQALALMKACLLYTSRCV